MRYAEPRTYHEECSLEPIALTVPQEVADRQYRQHEQGDHEYLKVEVHGFPEGPPDENHQRAVEKCGLYRGPETVVESNVDDAI